MPMTAKDKIVGDWSTRSRGAPFIVWPNGCRDLIVTIETDQYPKIFLTGLESISYPVYLPAGTMFYGIRLAAGVRNPWKKDDSMKDIRISCRWLKRK